MKTVRPPCETQLGGTCGPETYWSDSHAHAICLVRSERLLLRETCSVPERDTSQRVRGHDGVVATVVSSSSSSTSPDAREHPYTPDNRSLGILPSFARSAPNSCLCDLLRHSSGHDRHPPLSRPTGIGRRWDLPFPKRAVRVPGYEVCIPPFAIDEFGDTPCNADRTGTSWQSVGPEQLDRWRLERARRRDGEKVEAR